MEATCQQYAIEVLAQEPVSNVAIEAAIKKKLCEKTMRDGKSRPELHLEVGLPDLYS